MKRSIIISLVLTIIFLAGFYLLRINQKLPSSEKALPPCEGIESSADEPCWRLKLKTIAEGLSRPLGIANAGDGSNRLFIIEKQGTIRVVENQTLLESPFLDISDKVGSSGDEQGLLGLAFHPDYANNGFFFVNYTDLNGNTVVSRFSVDSSNPDKADPGSETEILAIEQPDHHHKCGHLAFGPDGYLYICTGDGGEALSAQDTTSLLGKLLRIDVDQGEPYSVPEDNPFVGEAEARGEIWALGLRNPWRFSFDRSTGDMYIGDNGEDLYEEVDFQFAGAPGGQNYGWPNFEGNHCTKEVYKESEKYFDYADCEFKYEAPIYEYLHEPPDINAAGDCSGSVIGGYVYRGQEYPMLDGIYIFADFCTGKIRGTTKDEAGNWQVTELLHKPDLLSTSFGENENGELYVVTFGNKLYKISAEIVTLR